MGYECDSCGKRLDSLNEQDSGRCNFCWDRSRQDSVCKGSVGLGTACGACSRCFEAMSDRCERLGNGLRSIAESMERWEQQNGFWGVASQHEAIKRIAIETLESERMWPVPREVSDA